MRHMMIMLGSTALAAAAPASVQPEQPVSKTAAQADTAAEITAIEDAWGKAFMTKDHAYVRSILAPEFTLMRAENGEVGITPVAEWLDNLSRITFDAYEVRTTGVTVAGDTAVATVEGGWKVNYPGRGIREESFILSDTWVRRDGAWKVIYRHSTPGPKQPPAQASKTERGR